jgi:hypothetical protein
VSDDEPLDEEILNALITLESRSRELLELEERPAARSWDTLESNLGLEPQERGMGLSEHEQAVSIVVGLMGGLLDLRPQFNNAMTDEDRHQELDAAFKKRLRKATGERGTVAIDNAMGGADHRLAGATHDLFRLFKTVQLVRRGEFEAAVKGVATRRSSYRAGFPDYLKIESGGEALVLVLMHWAADFFSARSLPIPGWSKLAEIDNKELVTWLFKVYREGANLRALISQFLSNMSGLALISLLLHLYRYIDMFWITKDAASSTGGLNLSRDFRFRLMSRDANLVALSITTGHAALTQNFLNWNYMAMIKFFSDARVVQSILDEHHQELDRQTDQLLAELEAR